ncbi:unnamed protein product [Boreogadus saida]
MAAVCHPRRALVEIPAPQPKIAAKLRRSYFEILGSRLAPSPAVPRGPRTSNTPRRPHYFDPSSGSPWRGVTDEPCEPIDEQQQRTALSNQQLAQLIHSLGLVEQSQEPRLLTFDLKYLQDSLQLQKANVFRSIPYSRFGSNRDAHCYRKAHPHLLAFKVSCHEWGQVLLRGSQWASALEYALMAWRYAGELPHWDTPGHNALRDQCFASLAAVCLAALRHHGDVAKGPAQGHQLLRRLRMAAHHSQAIMPCIQELERILEPSGDPAMERQ